MINLKVICKSIISPDNTCVVEISRHELVRHVQLLVKGISSDFHDRSSVRDNRSKIDHNRLRELSSQQHLLAISAAKKVIFQTYSGTVFGKKLGQNTSRKTCQNTSFLLFISIIIDAKFGDPLI